MSFRPWAAAQKLGGRDSLGDFVDPAVAGFSFVALGPSWNYFVINININYNIYILYLYIHRYIVPHHSYQLYHVIAVIYPFI
jgi:hypothetical protein